MNEDHEKEVKILSHEPWPGFRKAFVVVFIISSIYLATILYFSIPKLGH